MESVQQEVSFGFSASPGPSSPAGSYLSIRSGAASAASLKVASLKPAKNKDDEVRRGRGKTNPGAFGRYMVGGGAVLPVDGRENVLEEGLDAGLPLQCVAAPKKRGERSVPPNPAGPDTVRVRVLHPYGPESRLLPKNTEAGDLCRVLPVEVGSTADVLSGFLEPDPAASSPLRHRETLVPTESRFPKGRPGVGAAAPAAPPPSILPRSATRTTLEEARMSTEAGSVRGTLPVGMMPNAFRGTLPAGSLMQKGSATQPGSSSVLQAGLAQDVQSTRGSSLSAWSFAGSLHSPAGSVTG
eukprot:Hpha_TRINITY_DN16665_c0_g9::TRINITY_DN16665_c0_g9_i1::g.182200::m.182200